MSNHRPEKYGLGHIKGQIHRLGFTPLICDLNRISKQFSDLIVTESLEISLLLKGRFIADTVEIKPNEMPDA